MSNVRFHRESGEVARDRDHANWIGSAMGRYEQTRRATSKRFPDWESMREAAASRKQAVLDRLPELLDEFQSNMKCRGVQVHRADSAGDANALIAEILMRAKVRTVVKSKTMTAEEIGLTDFLSSKVSGLQIYETDLGEFVQQLRQERPYHFVFPCMHLRRDQIAADFRKHFGHEGSDDPETLTLAARQYLRARFLSADAAITGGNFWVANPGAIALTENEGNIRLGGALPRLMISLIGIEKGLETLDDLALFWPMLATAGTGQTLTCYNTIYTGPRQGDEPDGPEEWHVVLLDSGRSKMLANDVLQEALRCIRCGACLNVCPVFRHIGGHSYGSTYAGPIGAVIAPWIEGGHTALSHASTLCGACGDTCPVKIDLPRLLVYNRERFPAVSKPGAALLKFFLGGEGRFRWILRMFRRLPWKRTVKNRRIPDMAEPTFGEWWQGRKAISVNAVHAVAPAQGFLEGLPVQTLERSAVELFVERAGELRCDMHRVSSQELGACLEGVAKSPSWISSGLESFGLTASSDSVLGSECAVTPCHLLVAETGSVLVSSEFGRASTIVVEHHIVVAREDQIVMHLTEAMGPMRQLANAGRSMVSLVSGPSRTGDIERILVLGAHGPRRLTIVLVDA